MIISVPEHNYHYANLPKCGCSSAKLAIAKQVGVKFVGLVQSRYRRQNDAGPQLRAAGSYGWTIVRNPFARLVSCWAELHPPYRDRILELNHGLRIMKGWPFAAFIRHIVSIDPWRANLHYLPIVDLLKADDNTAIHQAFYLERIDTGWPIIQKRTGLGTFPHERQSEHPPYRTLYTDALRRMVESRFARDCELFGYDFDGPTKKGPVACEFA